MYINTTLVSKYFTEFKKHCSIWNTANDELYGLCKKFPDHHDLEQVVTKLWMIGRTYAAALERRRGAVVSTDELYTQVANTLITQLDAPLQALASKKQLSADNFAEMLELHKHLTEWFKVSKETTFPVKRSLASKYLHFHLPTFFPVYDANAAGAISRLVSTKNHNGYKHVDVTKYIVTNNTRYCDDEYRNFCLKVLALQHHLGNHHLKETDDFLLFCANQ